MTDFDNDQLSENVQNYFSILMESLCARIEGNAEREDSLLGYLEEMWNNFTPEEIGIINNIGDKIDPDNVMVEENQK
jgi:hypothetical protein